MAVRHAVNGTLQVGELVALAACWLYGPLTALSNRARRRHDGTRLV